MSTEIVTAIISAVTTFVVAFGSWHVSMARERDKTIETNRQMFESYRDELKEKFEGLRDEVTAVNANMQQQIALIELKIDTLSKHVEKHNQVVERTFKLEEQSAVHSEQIKALQKE